MTYYGIQKHTLIDYPGEVACTLFTYGCNFRCPYCHNPELINEKDKLTPIGIDEIVEFLKKRKKLLEGVCFTGGEPLMNNEIIDDIKIIKSLGFKIKIDTNGSFPLNLKKTDADYIAMDIKTSFKKYHYAGYQGRGDLEKKLKESINWIINSGIDHEFRTTVVPYMVDIDDIKEIVKGLKGTKKYVLSQFRAQNTLEPEWSEIIPYHLGKLEEMKKVVLDSGIKCEIRAGY
ncbi:MAG: anaerobic ribonucleoside-triphosphate reductase activating protein [Spirochaetes bacterium]|nr:anaerobic ribonucleoside-triphosphate reductase activating protein [Spirochaetota bacterium]